MSEPGSIPTSTHGSRAPCWARWVVSGGRSSGRSRPGARGKSLVLTSLGILLAASVVCLGLGIMALVARQPTASGTDSCSAGHHRPVVLGSLSPVALTAYRQAEMRKIQARDL